MKRVNGVMTPESFRECFGSWILFTAEVTCGLCLKGKQKAERQASVERSKEIQFESYYIAPEEFPKIQLMSFGKARAFKWRRYKRHIATAHNGNWNLNQGFGQQTMASK
jgi:hypothetical protein